MKSVICSGVQVGILEMFQGINFPWFAFRIDYQEIRSIAPLREKLLLIQENRPFPGSSPRNKKNRYKCRKRLSSFHDEALTNAAAFDSHGESEGTAEALAKQVHRAQGPEGRHLPELRML